MDCSGYVLKEAQRTKEVLLTVHGSQRRVMGIYGDFGTNTYWKNLGPQAEKVNQEEKRSGAFLATL